MSSRPDTIDVKTSWLDEMRPTFSVVVPVYNEEGNVEALVARVIPVMERLMQPFEILFVDDGSKDRTPKLLAELAAKDSRVRVIRFSRNYGQEAAVEALYLNARGRWLIQMDGDLQNPPEEIPKLIAKRDEGFDVVYGIREGRQDSMFRVAASRTMQWSMRSLMEIELPDDVSTFRLMSSHIARLCAALPERRKFFSALIVWSGARIGTVRVGHSARAAGTTKYNFTKLLNHTFDLVVGFSSKPLRYLGTIGVVFALFGFGLGAWTIARKVIWGYGAMGWSSIFAAVVVLSGVQLIALSLIGEYIARIYVQAQARPLFNIAERLNFGPNQAADELVRHSLEPAEPESARVQTPLSRPPISNRPEAPPALPREETT
ncbi:MAG: glycosyltransferase family 2 protein [Polyangiales bacterium]